MNTTYRMSRFRSRLQPVYGMIMGLGFMAAAAGVLWMQWSAPIGSIPLYQVFVVLILGPTGYALFWDALGRVGEGRR